MTLKTRKPTGQPSWPIMLLAGREGAGKSWAAAAASGSALVGRTFWIGTGEDDPDEYAMVPGARFEIVEHDGTYAGILGAVRDAVSEPAGEQPNMVVVDSMSRLWNLITDNAQAIANQRAKGRKNANNDYSVTPDLWNVAASQWSDVMDALRQHKGPVILTARLEQVTVMENGQPTAEKEWKVIGHKSLPFDSTVIMHMTERGSFQVTKVKSARAPLDKPKPYPDFTVEAMWRSLGIEDAEDRSHPAPRVTAELAEDKPIATKRTLSRDWVREGEAVSTIPELKAIYDAAEAANELGLPESEGSEVSVGSALMMRNTVLRRKAKEDAEHVEEFVQPEPTSDWETVQPGEGVPAALEGVEVQS